MAGWLDNYGKAENPNDTKLSFPEGFVGDGYNTKGRNYSPAWGGQFQEGGVIKDDNIDYDYVNYGTPEYEQAYNEGRFAFNSNQLDEVVVTPYDKQFPFYQKLKPSEQKYLRENIYSNDPITRQLKARATDGRGFDADKARDFAMGWLRDIPLASLQAPQSAMVEGIEALRGNEYNILNALEPDKQRVPSEAWNIENPYAAFATDMLVDPALVGTIGNVARKPIQKGLQQTGKYLTEETALRNAYKLNPYAFKPQEGMMYRGLGKEGVEDALQSGVFRARPTRPPGAPDESGVRLKGKGFGNDVYFSPEFEVADRYGKGFVGEVPKNSANWQKHSSPEHASGWSQFSQTPISIDQGKILQKDWLKGYKEIPKPTSSVDDVSKGFKSEIDWAKWNKEIPENKILMQEYNIIEQQAKANGTWMKYSDGSDFKGTPEQFVQMKHPNTQSFAGGAVEAEQMYKQDLHRGAHEHIVDFKNRNRNDYATFLTDNKKNAETYAGSDGMSKKYFHPDIDKEVEVLGKFYPKKEKGVYQLGIPQNLPKVVGNAEGRSWRLLKYDENIAKNIDGKNWDGSLTNYADEHNTFLKDVYERKHDLEGYGLTDYNPSKKYLSTDNYASYVKNKSNLEGIAEIKNVKDQMGFSTEIPANTVYAVDAERVPIKSLRYNNGMFDMTNPNIYKSILPIGLGLGAASQMQEEAPQYKKGGIIKDNNGYWNPDNWGKPVEIDSNQITMKGVNQPLVGVSDEGDVQMMYPEEEYKFIGEKVTEYPLAKNGSALKRLDDLTNFTNYNKPQSKGWLDKYN